MSLEDNARLPVVGVGENIGESWRTDVAKLGEKFVLKTDKNISQRIARLDGESDESYARRRLDGCFSFITGELDDERKARDVLPDAIIAPPEYHFIATGEDGFPAPFRIQSLVHGRSLDEIGEDCLTPEQESNVNALLRASMESYRKNRARLDLVGVSVGESLDPLTQFKKYLDPVGNSKNVFITKDGRVALVDVKLGAGRPHEHAATFLLTAICYWRRMAKQATRVVLGKR